MCQAKLIINNKDFIRFVLTCVLCYTNLQRLKKDWCLKILPLLPCQGIFNWFPQAKGGKEESSGGRNSEENQGRTDQSQRRSKCEVKKRAELKSVLGQYKLNCVSSSSCVWLSAFRGIRNTQRC